MLLSRVGALPLKAISQGVYSFEVLLLGALAIQEREEREEKPENVFLGSLCHLKDEHVSFFPVIFWPSPFQGIYLLLSYLLLCRLSAVASAHATVPEIASLVPTFTGQSQSLGLVILSLFFVLQTCGW